MSNRSESDKRGLRDELVALLAADLATLERAQRSAVEAATHEEAKPENDKDTRALEASYLARGHALRLEELRGALGELRAWEPAALRAEAPVSLGALAEVEDDAGTHTFFLAPHGGGLRLAGGAVQVVTPKSPIGRALLGKAEGDTGELVVEGRVRELGVLSVR
jgi:transcription elongation GreA/GreB family factor